MAITDRRGVSVDATDTPIAGDPNPGLAIKAPCLVATVGNIVLSGLQTINGVTLADGNRVLVWKQSDATTNGLYNASSGVWTRTVDCNSNDQIASGMLVAVTSGILGARSTFRLTSADPVTLGTSAVTFVSAGKFRVLFTWGQSNHELEQPYSWTPNPNAFKWNYSNSGGNVGTAFVALPTTTINIVDKIASDIADDTGDQVFLINISIGSQSIAHWLSGYMGNPVVSPDVYNDAVVNVPLALAAIGATQIDYASVWQGEADASPALNVNYIANHALVMQRFWSNSWFPKETPMLVHSIASNAISGGTYGDTFNVMLSAVVAADPDTRRFVYTAALTGATYWDTVLVGHMTGQGYFSMGEIAANTLLNGPGRDTLQNAYVDPTTGNITFGNPAVAAVPLLVNQNTGLTPPAFAGVEVQAIGTTSAHFLSDSFGGGFSNFIGRHADGTQAVPTALVADDLIAGLAAQGWDSGGGYASGNKASFNLFAAESWTATHHGTYASISLTAAGTDTLRQYYRFNAGSLVINYSTTAAPVTFAGVTQQTVAADNTTNFHLLDAFGTGFTYFIGRRAEGTQAAPTQLLSGDVITGIGAQGYDAVGPVSGNKADVTFFAGENWVDATHHGTYASVRTTPNASNTLAEAMRIQNGSWTVFGTASGSIKFQVPSAAGVSSVLTWPAGTTDFSATGGTSQVVKQTSAGGAFTVAQLAFSDLSGSLATLSYGTHLTNSAGAASYNGTAASTIATDATSANTASTIVARDGSGNFTATTITAALTGHASLDLALTGGTMSGAIAMGTNNITGVGTLGATTINAFALGGGVTAGGNNITGVGALTATTVNGNTLTTGTWTLNGGAAKGFTFNNSMTLAAGADSQTFTFPSTSATIARTDAGQTFTGTQVFGTISPTTINAFTLGGGITGGGNNITGVGTLGATTINAFTLGGGITAGGNNISGAGTISATTFSGALTGHASLDLALTGGTLSGGISMGGNSIVGLTTLAASGAMTLQSNGSTTAATILTNQNVGLGKETNPQATLVVSNNTTTGIAGAGSSRVMRVVGANATGTVLELNAFGSFTNIQGVRADGTAASPSAIAGADELLLNFSAYGYDGSAYYSTASWIIWSSQAFTAAAHGGSYLTAYTTPNNTQSIAEAMRIQNSGGVSVGTTTDPGIGNLNVAGGFIPGSFTVAALPAGVTGKTVMCTNCRMFNGAGTQEGAAAGTGGLVTYNGTAWKIEGTNVTAVA